MTQEYTPVAWQDETTSQQGTLINAERLNQMQTAHHYADGFEEVDAVPTADPGVAYHKVVYCTADSTFYRWDGTQWTKDIDDETKALLQQEIARATAAESELRGQLEDEHDARVDAEAAINDRITDETTVLAQRIATEASTRYTADTALGTRITNEASARETADTALGNRITAEATARAEADTALGGRIDTEQARAEAAEQANAQAIANTYTKAEIDTALGAKADVATTYTKTETDALLALKADQATTYTKAETDTLLGAKANDNAVVHKTGDETVAGTKTFTALIYRQGTNPALRFRNTAQEASPTLPMAEEHQTRIGYLPNDSDTEIGAAVFGNNVGGDGYLTLNIRDIRSNSPARIILRQYYNGDSYVTAPYRAYSAGNTTDVATIGTLDAYTPMVRTSGNQSIGGTKTFLDPIYGRLVDPLYEEYSGNLPGGKYRIFARIPAANTNTMLVLDVMISANGSNYGFGRLLVGNPTTVSWFCKWVYRKSNAWLNANVIQIAKETATGDLLIFAMNPTITGLSINLVYSKIGSSIHGAVRVTKVTGSADYALDGTDTGLENIVPGSDMA